MRERGICAPLLAASVSEQLHMEMKMNRNNGFQRFFRLLLSAVFVLLPAYSCTAQEDGFLDRSGREAQGEYLDYVYGYDNRDILYLDNMTSTIVEQIIIPGQVKQYNFYESGIVRIVPESEDLILKASLYLKYGEQLLPRGSIRTDEADVIAFDSTEDVIYQLHITSLQGSGSFRIEKPKSPETADISGIATVWDVFLNPYEILRYSFVAEQDGSCSFDAGEPGSTALYLWEEGSGELVNEDLSPASALTAALEAGKAYRLAVVSLGGYGGIELTRRWNETDISAPENTAPEAGNSEAGNPDAGRGDAAGGAKAESPAAASAEEAGRETVVYLPGEGGLLQAGKDMPAGTYLAVGGNIAADQVQTGPEGPEELEKLSDYRKYRSFSRFDVSFLSCPEGTRVSRTNAGLVLLKPYRAAGGETAAADEAEGTGAETAEKALPSDILSGNLLVCSANLTEEQLKLREQILFDTAGAETVRDTLLLPYEVMHYLFVPSETQVYDLGISGPEACRFSVMSEYYCRAVGHSDETGRFAVRLREGIPYHLCVSAGGQTGEFELRLKAAPELTEYAEEPEFSGDTEEIRTLLGGTDIPAGMYLITQDGRFTSIEWPDLSPDSLGYPNVLYNFEQIYFSVEEGLEYELQNAVVESLE